MSKVRVYELAKEAGISSKALTEKLIELGYEIKGHSSTVDAETADKIRETVLKSIQSKVVEKRIDRDTAEGKTKGKTVIRRRAVIRRRPKAEKEEAVEQEPQEAPVTAAAEKAAAESAADVTPEKTEKKDTAVESAPMEKRAASAKEVSPKKEEKPEVEIEQPAEPVAAVASVPVEKEVPAVVVAEKAEEKQEKPEPKRETAPVAVAKAPAESAPVKEKPVGKRSDGQEKKNAGRQQPPQRKGAARILRHIELPTETKEEKPARPKKKAKSAPAKRGDFASAGAPFVPAPVEDSGRSRKKGRKGRGGESERDFDSRRSNAGSKRGGKNVKYTHFGNDYQERDGGGRRRKNRKAPKPVAAPSEMKASKRKFKVYDTITVGDLAQNMKVKAGEVIAKLMGLGVMATINQQVDIDTATIIASDFDYEVEQGITEEIGMQLLEEAEEGGEQHLRSPVVTVMGHVDHGKTSILDAIRKTDVAEGEAGGITQHIGAYRVKSAAGNVTFVDTPGHAAFTEMRSRGAQVTDIVVLVVAADDGVMDQTREAINHAQAADVPIIVAVNKIDKDNADPDRVKRELSELNLMPEEWGGDTMFVETSAKKNQGIDTLMESIQLLAELLELKADSNRKARGRVIEAQLHKGRGAVATVLVQDGTLKLGDYFVVGQFSGKVRAMLDDRDRKIDSAGPAVPVEVQGLSGVPSAGDEFIVVPDEKMAKNVSQERSLKARESELGAGSKISLDSLFEQMSQGDVKELRVVLRSDVQGTLQAFAKAAEELSTDEIRVKVLHEGTGAITESDVLLASASDAIIIGFNVRAGIKVKELAAKESVDVRSYDVIYHALDDIRKAMVGMLEPEFEEEVIGLAEVRDTFSVPKIGVIAGCAVVDGKIVRGSKVRVIRDGVVIYTGKIDSLKRFKDDAKEVLSGYECGIGVEKYNDIKVGDNLEAFVMNEVEATL